MRFQIITENDAPKFVVLPFGDTEALEDYIDELWAEKAVAEYEAGGKQKTYSIEEAKKILDSD